MRRPAWPCTVASLFLGVSLWMLPASAVDPVKAELGLKTAWTGQAVPLIITLYSPGPFSGTAAFELPQISKTNFVSQGRPLVGSETVDGESFITQRHELMLYTQKTGNVVIPPFRVRFSGAESFTTDPQPREGMTAELSFESKRPPRTEGMSVIVCATSMQVEQTWKPSDPSTLTQGDVIIRKISRVADGTTAMLLPPIRPTAESGIQVYQGSPEVEDVTVRSVSDAKRVDTLRYQFPQPGTFTLPEIELRWWNPKSEKLQSKTLDGMEIDVAVDPTAPRQVDAIAAEDSGHIHVGRLSMTMLAIGITFIVIWMTGKRIRQRVTQPEAVARRTLKAACRSNHPRDAYEAFLTWWRLAGIAAGDGSSQTLDELLQESKSSHFEKQWRQLSRRLYGSSQTRGGDVDGEKIEMRDQGDLLAWNGTQFWQTYQAWWQVVASKQAFHVSEELPALNPPLPEKGTAADVG